MLLLVFGARIGEAAAALLGLGPLFMRTWNILQWPVIMLCALTSIGLVYYLAPAVRQRWTWITPGSAFAMVAWLAMSFVLRLYVLYFGNYNATYGSIGGVILLMLWLYWTSLALLVGAEINAQIGDSGTRRPQAAETGSPRQTGPAAPRGRLRNR